MQLDITLEFPNTTKKSQFTAEVSYERMLEAVKTAIVSPSPTGPSYVDLVVQMVPDAWSEIVQTSLGFGNGRVCDIQPNFVVQGEPESWLVGVFQYPNETDNVWMFFYKRQYVPVPEGCRIRPETGDIFLEYEGHKLEVLRPSSSIKEGGSWPWVLLNPRAWIALDEMKNVMRRTGTNPLSIMLRSPNPMRGLASQLKGSIEQAIRMLEEALTDKSF